MEIKSGSNDKSTILQNNPRQHMGTLVYKHITQFTMCVRVYFGNAVLHKRVQRG